MAAVVELAGVSIVRNGSTLINNITWDVDESDRWVVIGPNGAGKTTLLQVISAQIHPTTGVAGLLGEVLGTVDVFELRPRIGLTSAALAERIPRGERVHQRLRHRPSLAPHRNRLLPPSRWAVPAVHLEDRIHRQAQAPEGGLLRHPIFRQ